jgi:hypothetical protein
LFICYYYVVVAAFTQNDKPKLNLIDILSESDEETLENESGNQIFGHLAIGR